MFQMFQTFFYLADNFQVQDVSFLEVRHFLESFFSLTPTDFWWLFPSQPPPRAAAPAVLALEKSRSHTQGKTSKTCNFVRSYLMFLPGFVDHPRICFLVVLFSKVRKKLCFSLFVAGAQIGKHSPTHACWLWPSGLVQAGLHMSLKRHIHVRFLRTRAPANLVRPFALTFLVHFLSEWITLTHFEAFLRIWLLLQVQGQREHPLTPTPLCVAFNMCASSKNLNIPSEPQPPTPETHHHCGVPRVHDTKNKGNPLKIRLLEFGDEDFGVVFGRV